jgi:integrase
MSPSCSRPGRGRRSVIATSSVGGFEAARDAAELPEHLTYHSLRHAFASLAAHRRVPVNVLSEVMGHSNVGGTQRVYMHLYNREQVEDDFRKAMAGG